MPLIAGLTLSHLSYPVVAWIQVQTTNKWALWRFARHKYHRSMQAVLLLLFLVGQVIIRMNNDTLYLEHNLNKLIL